MFPPRDRAFDRICALTAMLFDAPMAGIVSRRGVEACLGPALPDALEHSPDALHCSHVEMTVAPYARFFASVPLRGVDGERVAVLYVADTHPRHPAERQLKALEDLAEMATAELRQRHMATIVAAAPQMVFVQEATTGRVTYVNNEASSYASTAQPLSPEAVHDEDRGQVDTMSAQLDRYDARAEATVRVSVDGVWRWLHLKKRVSRCDAQGAPTELTCVATDVTDAKETQRQLVEARDELAQLVTTDELTQVPNKRALNARLTQLVAEGKRGRRFAVVMADVDHFKKVNDTFGHAEGDRVLKAVAQVLSKNVRETDLVARFGGEEFCVLLTDVDGPTAHKLSERLRLAIESMAGPFRMTMSFGVAACSTNDRADAAALLGAADDALYRAKEAGRNRVAMARRVMPSASAKKGTRQVAA